MTRRIVGAAAFFLATACGGSAAPLDPIAPAQTPLAIEAPPVPAVDEARAARDAGAVSSDAGPEAAPPQ